MKTEGKQGTWLESLFRLRDEMEAGVLWLKLLCETVRKGIGKGESNAL